MTRDRDILGLPGWDEAELPAGPSAGKASLTGAIGRQRESSAPVSPGKVSLSMQLDRPGGEALPYRDRMEALFGQDFSALSVSTGQREALAGSGARAAARGEAVAFASTTPDPALVAHELTHVVQQRRAGSLAAAAAKEHSDPSDASEREARAVQQHVAVHGMVGPLPEITAPPSATLHLDSGGALITADDWEKQKAKPKDQFEGPVTWSFLGDVFEIRLARAGDDDVSVEITYQGTYPVDTYTMPGQPSPARTVKVTARRRYPSDERKGLAFNTKLLARTADSLSYDLFGDGLEQLVLRDRVDVDGVAAFDRRTHLMGVAINGFPALPVWFEVHLPGGDGTGGPAGDREVIVSRPIKLLRDGFTLRTRRHGDADEVVVSLAHPKGEAQVLVPFVGGPSRRLGLDLLVNDGRNLQVDLDGDGKADLSLIHTVRQFPPPGLGGHRRHFGTLDFDPGGRRQDPYYVHEVAAYDLAGVLLGRMVQKLTGYPGAVPPAQDALQTPAPAGAATPFDRAPGQGDRIDEVSQAIKNSGSDWELRVDGDGDRIKELLLRFVPKQPGSFGKPQEFTLHVVQVSSGFSLYTDFFLVNPDQADHFTAVGPRLLHSPDGHNLGAIDMGDGNLMEFGLNPTATGLPEGKVQYDFYIGQRSLAFVMPAEDVERPDLLQNVPNVSEVAGMLTTEIELSEYQDRFRITVQKVDQNAVQFGLAALDGTRQVAGMAARLTGILQPRLQPVAKAWNAASFAVDPANDAAVVNLGSSIDPPADPQGEPIKGMSLLAARDHRIRLWTQGTAQLDHTFPVREGRFVAAGWEKGKESRSAAGASDAAGVLAEQAKHPELAEFRIQIDAAIDAAINNPSASKYIDGLHVEAWNALRMSMILIGAQATGGDVDAAEARRAGEAVDFVDAWLVDASNMGDESYQRWGAGYVTRTAPGEPGPSETWTGTVRNKYTNATFAMEESFITEEKANSVTYGRAVAAALRSQLWPEAMASYGRFREGVRAWISQCFKRDAKKGEESPEAQQLDYLGKMSSELDKLDKIQRKRLELDSKLDAEIATAAAKGVVPTAIAGAWTQLREDMVLLVSQTAQGEVDEKVSGRTAATVGTLGNWLRGEAGDRFYKFGDARGNAYTGETQKKDDDDQWVVSSEGTAALLAQQIKTGELQRAGQTYNRLRDAVVRWVVKKYETDPNFKDPVAAARMGKLQADRASKRDVVRVAGIYQADDSFESKPDKDGYKRADFGKYKTIPLTLFVWADGGNWHIRDVSNPDKVWNPAGVAFNGEDQPPEALFHKLDHHKHLPKGWVTYHLPDGSGKRIRLNSDKEWYDHVRDWAMIIGLIGLALLTGGAALGVLAAVAIPVAIAVSVSAALSIVADIGELVDAHREGFADDELIFTNVFDIASNLAMLGAMGAGKLAMGAEQAAVKAEQEGAAAGWTGLKAFAGKAGAVFYKPLLGVGLALNGYNLVLMTSAMIEQLQAADKIADPVERMKARAQIIATFAVTGAMMVLSIRGDLPALTGRSPTIVLDKVGGRTVARVADVHVGKTRVDLPEGNANLHAGARWQAEETRYQAEFGKGKAKGDAAAVAEDAEFQRRYADWLGQGERIDARGKVIMPHDTPPPVRERVQRMADSGDLGIHQQAFATADEVALLRKEAGGLDMDPAGPEWKHSVRPQLEDRLASHVGERRARAMVSRYEAARLGGKGNVADYAAQRARINKVLPESEIERLKTLYPGNEIHVTGDLASPQAAVGKGTDAVEIAVVVGNDTSPEVMAVMEQRAQGHKVLPDPEFTKATGKETLNLRVKVMTEDQFFGMATASRRGEAAPRYHRVDQSVGDAIDFGVPVRAQSATHYAVDADKIELARNHWRDKPSGEGRVSRYKYDPDTNTVYFEVQGSKVGQGIRVGAPLPPRITSAADLAKPNRMVGRPVKANEGLDILRRVNDGELAALDATGVHLGGAEHELPPGTEFGLGELPNGDLVIIRGELGAVDWTNFPGVKPLAHTHPNIKGNNLQGVERISVAELGTPSFDGANINRGLVFPTAEDLAVMVARRMDGHRVVTSFHVRDGWVFKPGGSNVGHPLDFVIHGAEEVGRLPSGERVYKATVTGHAGGEQVMPARETWGVVDPQGHGSYVELHEPAGMIRNQVEPPHAGAAAPRPTGPRAPAIDVEAVGKAEVARQGVTGKVGFPPPLEPDEFVARFGSRKGRAVFVLEPNGEVKIYTTTEARRIDVIAEIYHAKQLQNPEMAAEIRRLHGVDFKDNWDQMPAGDRLEHFRRKLAIEIDAHMSMLGDLHGRERVEIAGQLHDLRQLRRRAESITPTELAEMNAGLRKMEPFLEDPAWLFNKKRGPHGAAHPDAVTTLPKDDKGMLLPAEGAERSAAYSNLKDVDSVRQLGSEWQEHWQITTGYEGQVTAIRPNAAGGTTIEITDGGKVHSYELEPKAEILVEVDPDRTIPKGTPLGNDPPRRYRYVEIEFNEGKAGGKRVDRRQEIRTQDGSWVQRGSESTNRGVAMEKAARAQVDEDLAARKAAAEAKGHFFDSHRLRYPQGSGGFDDVIVQFTGSAKKPKARLRIREVKDYPDRHVPLADFTAIRPAAGGGNLDTNMGTLRTTVDTEVTRLREDPNAQPGGPFSGRSREDVFAIGDAVRANHIDFEVVLGPDTLIGREGAKGSSVLQDLRDELKGYFDGKDVLKRSGGKYSPERVRKEHADAFKPPAGPSDPDTP